MPVFTEPLADNVYRRDGFKPPHPYEIRRVVETLSGFRGAIYRNKESGDYIVAHTGTEFDTDKLRDGLLTDAQMWLMKGNQQLDDTQNQMEPSPAGFKKATRASSRRLNQSLLASEVHGLR